MAEAAFSEDGKYYSAISTDGRLKIWDTETNELKQQYTPDLHLTSPPSCLHWITVTVSTGQTPKQKKKKASISENEAQCIALGTHSGKVLLYSVAQAKIETILSGRIFSKVTALDWSRQYGLYSCSKDDMLIEWDIHNGTPRNQYKIAVENKNKQGNSISAIKIVPHKLESEAHYLVAASWQVRLWRLHKGEASIIKTLGHNASQTALLALAQVNNVCWLIEGSQNERLLSFWDITITEDHTPLTNGDEPTPSKKQKKRKKSLTNVPIVNTPTYNFVLEDAPRMVDVGLKEEEGMVKLSLAAATRSGVVHYYAQTLNGSSVKPMKPSVTLQAASGDAEPLPLSCCRLQPAGDLLLGYSQGPLMAFETVTPDLKTKTQVLIRGNTKPASHKQNDTTKVRSDKGSHVQVVEPMGGVASRKRMMPGGQIEVPMEARLSNLSLDVTNRTTTAVNLNFTKLLMQGLHSKDREIINTVLLKNRMDVAMSTVSALPAEYVPAFLNELSFMAVKKTSACLRVCTWLAALLRCHSALLLALINSEHSDQLTHLLAIFTNRRSHLCQLMNLKGRLDLTIQQRDAVAKHNKDRMKAILEYKDASSDEEMVVNERARSDSEGSWGDDKFADKSDDDKMDQDTDDDDNDTDDDSDDDDDEE